MRFTAKLFILAVIFCLAVCGWISGQTSQTLGTHRAVRKHQKFGRVKRSKRGKRHLFKHRPSATSPQGTATGRTDRVEMKKAGEFKGDLRDLPKTKPIP